MTFTRSDAAHRPQSLRRLAVKFVAALMLVAAHPVAHADQYPAVPLWNPNITCGGIQTLGYGIGSVGKENACRRAGLACNTFGYSTA